MLAGKAISWKSEKQFVIAASTIKVEFMACFEAIVHIKWLQSYISGLGFVDCIAKLLKI